MNGSLLVGRIGIGLGATVVAIESAVATRNVALASGVAHDPVLAWLTPLGIEGLATAFVALRAHQRSSGPDDGRRELVAAGLFGALAVWINVSAVTGDALIGHVIAAATPLGLMAAGHLFPWGEAKKESGKRATATSRAHDPQPHRSDARADIARASRPRARKTAAHVLTSARADAPSSARGLTSERRAELLRIERDEPGLNHTEMGERLSVSKDTARRWRKQIADSADAA